MHIRRNLIDFVEKEYGVDGACVFHAVKDTAGHCADISTAVATDFRLVLYTAKAHTDKLSTKRAGDGLRNARFTYARGAYKAQDRRFHAVRKL